MNKPVRLLIVEDNPGDADLTRDTLEASHIPFEISVVVDGAEAVDYLLRKPPFQEVETPSLILLDLNLPKLDGREVLAEMRRSEALRSIPVVVLSSSDAERDIVQSYSLGASCYVTKPIDLKSYQEAVRSIEAFWLTVAKLP